MRRRTDSAQTCSGTKGGASRYAIDPHAALATVEKEHSEAGLLSYVERESARCRGPRCPPLRRSEGRVMRLGLGDRGVGAIGPLAVVRSGSALERWQREKANVENRIKEAKRELFATDSCSQAGRRGSRVQALRNGWRGTRDPDRANNGQDRRDAAS
jgi:hypothetical protein